MAVNWTTHVKLRDGRIAAHIGRCDLTGKNRVRTYKDPRGHNLDATEIAGRTDLAYTTWLLDDEGRAGRNPCGEDYASAA